MKLVATGVLAVAAVGFLGLSLVPGDSLAIGALRSALEAATVGGFADWFAVVALFRYPCGVRIPHTALVPNNQARIASSLGTFVETNFIDPDDISAKFGGWLGGALLWHFAAMWLMFAASAGYLSYGLLSGHFRKTLLPVTPKGVARDVADAVTGRLDHRLGVRNQVPRLLYIAAIAGIVLMLLSGLAIWKPVQLQELTALFGGYDTAREIHFFGMCGLVLFLVVHLGLTALVPKVLPPMITGRGHVPLDVLEAEGGR